MHFLETSQGLFISMYDKIHYKKKKKEMHFPLESQGNALNISRECSCRVGRCEWEPRVCVNPGDPGCGPGLVCVSAGAGVRARMRVPEC